MDELDAVGIKWGDPGSQPEWPPLRELGSNLYSFREEVIRRGERDQVTELVGFDYWVMNSGMRRGCGELFTVGLAGYRHNCEIANRMGERELLETFRYQLWRDAPLLVSNAIPSEASPYIRQMMSHQERLLNDAMQADYPTAYERLHSGFRGFLQTIGRYWKLDRWRQPETEELYKGLEQDYRIALMGLGGRAVFLGDSGRISDSSPYLDVVRGEHVRAEKLADDIAQVLAHDNAWEGKLWSEWDTEDADNFEARSVYPQKYPLTWFAIRLIELSTGPIQTLDLHGNARRVLDWFTANPAELATHVRDLPAPTVEERRNLATDALRLAVRRDEMAEDYEIIRYDLSAEKVSAFEADVYATALGPNSIERLFERAGAILDLPTDAEGGPDERRIHSLEHKGFLADLPEDARTYYARLEGYEWGRSLSRDVIERFCKALSDTPLVTVPLNAPGALLQAIDEAIDDLKPSGELVVVLTGDWWDVVLELNAKEPEGYEPDWRIPEADRVGDIGRYSGVPIFRGPSDDERRLYVVELRAWGCLVRARIEGNDHPLVEVRPISVQRAQELLRSNSCYFPDESDEASKLRKLQTRVEIVVSDRTGFRVTDTYRARRIH